MSGRTPASSVEPLSSNPVAGVMEYSAKSELQPRSVWEVLSRQISGFGVSGVKNPGLSPLIPSSFRHPNYGGQVGLIDQISSSSSSVPGLIRLLNDKQIRIVQCGKAYVDRISCSRVGTHRDRPVI
jgi:hypothetical protein